MHGRKNIKLTVTSIWPLVFLFSVKSGLTFVQSALNRCTVQPFTESEDTRCCENTICPPEDGHVNARNMSRIVV